MQRRYAAQIALQGVDVDLAAGELLVVLGPNGAGKSTLIHILAGLDRRDGGELEVAGGDPWRAPARDRARLGLVGHQPLLYPDLTAEENLRFHARLHGLPSDPEFLRAALESVDLLRHRHRRARDLSRGMRQRLDIARAGLHRPSLLLLDEPFGGLDPAQAERSSDLLRARAARGAAILVSSHDLARAGRLADRLLILHRGRAVWSGSATEAEAADLEALYRRVTAEEAAAPAAGRAGPAARQRELVKAPPTEVHPERSVTPAPTDHPVRPIGPLGAMLALAGKDLRIELRAREILPPVLVFALLATVIFQFALPRQPDGQVVGAAGAIWLALLLGSTLGLTRALAGEQDCGAWAGLRLAPIDPAAIFGGKWLAGYLMGLIVAAGLLPAAVVWLGIPAGRLPALAGLVALGLIGWVAAGTLTAAMAVGTRAREVLLPVLLFPVVLPLVIAIVQATDLLLVPPPDLAFRWQAPLIFIAAFDLIFLVLGFLLLPFVLEA